MLEALGVGAMLLVQAGLIFAASPRNAVTFDEASHLPAGLRYWREGRFWCYHHNPPLARLITALPVALAGYASDDSRASYIPQSRRADDDIARRFLIRNREHYFDAFLLARLTVLALTSFGGLVVYLWSRELFGVSGGLVSLSLWTFCPNILAHGGLATTDMGATVFGLIASYAFWHYLQRPTWRSAAVSGLALGLAMSAKFSFVVLPLVWVPLAILSEILRRSGLRGVVRVAPHALISGLACLFVVNNVYQAEGFGRRLDSFEFHSGLLTRPASSSSHPGERENRFSETWLGAIHVPLPEHFLLGFDDQAFDVDTFRPPKYLRGEVRRNENGWWYYYLYGFAVKTPLGTLGLLALAVVVGVTSRRNRSGPVAELAVLAPAALLFGLVSSQTGLNSHFRYVLPVLPSLFIAAGRLGPWASRHGWAARSVVAAGVVGTAVSVTALHPDYLTYFHEAAGGPDGGIAHLADSNVDWGQGLIALGDWVREHGRGRRLRLAYFGRMDPELVGIRFELPPFGVEAEDSAASELDREFGPVPGLHAVSANYRLGCIPVDAPNGSGGLRRIPFNAFTYFRHFKPVAIVAHSIYIYELGVDEVNQVRRGMGLPPWSGRAGAEPAGSAWIPYRGRTIKE
jgi:4-amino-4-deoxy-L-arabinose transferase-like glycosyltransferase